MNGLVIIFLCNSYTTVCPPVRGNNRRASARELFLEQAYKPWYYHFILPLAKYEMMKYSMLKSTISGKGELRCSSTYSMSKPQELLLNMYF